MQYAAGYEVLAINQIKASDVTFDNTIKALIDLEREMTTEEGPIIFPQHVVTDKAIRDASVAADKKLSTFEVDLSMKKEVRKRPVISAFFPYHLCPKGFLAFRSEVKKSIFPFEDIR